MLHKTILSCLVRLVLVEFVEKSDASEITFKILTDKVKNGTDGRSMTIMSCDHTEIDMNKNIYTVLEGEEFQIKVAYKKYVNHLICAANNNPNQLYNITRKDVTKNIYTFKADKYMGTIWKCTVYSHRDSETILPVVMYMDHKYTAAFCYMKIHIRQKVSPQTILVNNMVLETVRTPSSEKDIDRSAEHEFVDGDDVSVACADFKQSSTLTMNSDIYPLSDTSLLPSKSYIGFTTKLYSGHHNTSMICMSQGSTDYTKVKITFIIRRHTDWVSIQINGMVLRPKPLNQNSYRKFEYKYLVNEWINLVCAITHHDVKLLVFDNDIRKITSYSMGYVSKDQAIMKFYLKDDNKIRCAADNITSGTSLESTEIKFTKATTPDQYPLEMEFSANGTLMEFHAGFEHKIIYYEYDDGDTLNITCRPKFNFTGRTGPVIYMQMNNSKLFDKGGGGVFQALQFSGDNHKSETACYLKEQAPGRGISKDDTVLREIRVSFLKKVLTTTTTTVAPTTVTTAMVISTTNNLKGAGDITDTDEALLSVIYLSVIGGGIVIIIICLFVIIFKMRKRVQSQTRPNDNYYENLPTPSENSIPPYPAQWGGNEYAVPSDLGQVPNNIQRFRVQGALYTAPVKNNRFKKNNTEQNYAVLDIKARVKRNTIKETEDPNYAEVYSRGLDQCYAKVLPKSEREKQDKSPYANVSNVSPYANTSNAPDPTYSEVNSDRGHYANINNDHYANFSGQQYIEPTYSEPSKRKK